MKRSGFYDVEISGRWFYIHIPERLPKIYVVATYPSAMTQPSLREAATI